jgi:hypothetical protein
MVIVPREPTAAMWGELARDIIMWMDMHHGSDLTPRILFAHLERIGRDIPRWLRDEPELQALDHVPSKGTRAVLVYRAMIQASEAPRLDLSDPEVRRRFLPGSGGIGG